MPAPQMPRRPAGTAEAPAPTVRPQAVEVQALPYLLIVLLLGLLTLPPPWAGLQLIDGAILLAAFGAYLVHALMHGPPQRPGGPMPEGAGLRALVGLPAIVAGGLASVIGAQRFGAALGIPEIVSGLFVIGFLCAVPESFAAWSLAPETTTAVSAAMGGGIVSLTVALLPSTLIGAAVGNVTAYAINLGFLTLMLIAYIVLNQRGQVLRLGFVSLFRAGYLACVGATLWAILR